MTTTETTIGQTPAAVPVSRVRPNGETQYAYDADKVALVIRTARKREGVRDHIVPARGGEGTGTYGLYLEVVNQTPGHESHMRYFVAGPNVYASSRSKGMSKANWRHRKAESLEKVLAFLDGVLARPEIKLFGRPLLVEMQADDVSQVEAGQMPAARFRGQYRTEKDFGKYDFDPGEIRSEPWPNDFPHI